MRRTTAGTAKGPIPPDYPIPGTFFPSCWQLQVFSDVSHTCLCGSSLAPNPDARVMGPFSMRSLHWVERVLIAIGCGCLTVTGMRLVEAASFQRAATETLERELAAAAPAAVVDKDVRPVSAVSPMLAVAPTPAVPRAAPLDTGLIGRLEIPRLHVSVIVMDGDDDATLARAVGHLPGTALPWEAGNVVMAGHRDTFFRPLKDLREGDEIRVTTSHGTFDYRVIRMEIVEPDDVSVLAPTPVRSLTLVTCYPFVYVGSAPQRFIVHAR